MADGYAAAQNWAIALVVVAGLGYYYISTSKKPTSKHVLKSAPLRETKSEIKKTAKKAQKTYSEKSSAATGAATAPESEEQKPQTSQNGIKKRKADTQAPIQTTSVSSVSQVDEDEIDMSTRHFAESLRKAQKGTDLKTTDKAETRVKTVKAKNSQANAALMPGSGSSSQAGDEDRAPTGSTIATTSGIDDMLEPIAPGPNSLRITASTKPVKQKVSKPKKEVQDETKKARQNRQRKEAEQAARAEADAAQKVLMEKQRRTAREARGEPARNGASVPSAPTKNPWAEQNAAREAQVVSSSNQAPLLDTFEVESNSSSNAEISTAATSTTDSAPNSWKDNVASGEDELSRALEESNNESGWSQVKTKKLKNKASQIGNSTPVQKPAVVSSTKSQPQKKASGFDALEVEDVDESSTWTA